MFTKPAFSQDTARFTHKQKLVLAGEGLVYGGSLTGLTAAWYTEPRTHFHFFDDSGEWLQIDKVGHFTTSYHSVRISNLVMTSAGIKDKTALNIATFGTLAYMTLIEVIDGFSPSYGASVSDLAVDLGGAGLYYLQARTNTTEYFTFKFSYKYSGLAHYRPKELGKSGPERMLKDYNGQTYWLSMNVRKFTGVQAVPDWLSLAVGYGGTGMLGGFSNPDYNEAGQMLPHLDRRREYSLSFDIDTEKLFKKKKGINKLFRAFSFIKVPLPGVTFSHGSSPKWALFAH